MRSLRPHSESTMASSSETVMHTSESLFDQNNVHIKEDIISMIIQYLDDEGFTEASTILKNEAMFRAGQQSQKVAQFGAVKDAIIEGDWVEVESKLTSLSVRDAGQLQYFIYKQRYLELIEQSEVQKAFVLLCEKLKPLESQVVSQSEFRDLCYLLTCKSIQDVSSFKSWEGISTSREKLVEQLSVIFDLDAQNTSETPQRMLQPNRLVHLLRQAVRYQVERSQHKPKILPKIGSLLQDYNCFVLPNALKATLRGHKDNVKCVDFVGDKGQWLVSGSSDNSVRLWDIEEGTCVVQWGGGGGGVGMSALAHTSRVWEVCSNPTSQLLASASGDSTVKLWKVPYDSTGEVKRNSAKGCLATLHGHERDVYSVDFHPSSSLLASGGYDKLVRVWDSNSGTLLQTLSGHTASISRVLFAPHGNLLLTGSKDSSICFWDLTSGICVKSFTSHLGEVTSVEMSRNGMQVLSGSKDNSNRLWDVRSSRPIQRFKGHQNTSKNFVRASFGPNEELIVGGSEDGFVYIWDASTAELLQCLGTQSDEDGHEGTVYRAVWNSHSSVLASCAHDTTIKLWWYDQSMP